MKHFFSRFGRLFLFLAITNAQAAIQYQPNTLNDSQKNNLSNLLEQVVANQKLAGLVAAATLNDKVIWADGAGVSSVESNNPIIFDHHLFRWASVGKVYTFAVAQYLSEMGAVDLNKPIVNYYPNNGPTKYYKRCFTTSALTNFQNCQKSFGNGTGISSIVGNCFDVTRFDSVKTSKGFNSLLKDQNTTSGQITFTDNNGAAKCNANYTMSVENLGRNDAPITLKMLLDHRSGIQHYSYLGNKSEPSKDLISNTEAIEDRRDNDWSYMRWAIPHFYPKHPLLTKPGLADNYTTFGYNLAGVALEKASAMSFQKLMDGMSTKMGTPSFQTDLFGIQPEGGFQRVQVHTIANAKLVTNPYDTDNSYKLAGGGIISNIVDLGRFCAAASTPNYFKTKGIASYSHTGSHDDRSASILQLKTQKGQRQCIVLMTNTNHNAVDLAKARDAIRNRLEMFGYWQK